MWGSLFHTLTQVIMDLRTRPTGTCLSHSPVVVFFPKAEDTVGRQSDPLIPQFISLIIIEINCRIKPVFGHPVDFCNQSPSIIDRVFFEIVPERKISQHFKECVMFVCDPNLFEVVMFSAYTHTLLNRSRPFVAPFFQSEKHILELVHSCIREQNCGIILRKKRGTSYDFVISIREKVEERLPDLLGFHLLFFFNLRFNFIFFRLSLYFTHLFLHIFHSYIQGRSDSHHS